MHSQHREEEFILQNVPQEGIFLDVGAFDGATFSNSLALVERGWRGVLVEPGLTGFKALLERHGSNGNLSLVHALVGTSRGLPRFWDSPDMVSTTETANYETWKREGQYHAPYYSAQVTVRDLFRCFPVLRHVQFVSIDTEGTSASLFAEFPWDTCHPRCFCVEFDGDFNELMERAGERGYRNVYRSDENVVLARA